MHVNHLSVPELSPPSLDRFEVALSGNVKFIGRTGKREAVLVLRAPKRLWIQEFDWVEGPYPSDIKISYAPSNKINTDLVRRLHYHRTLVKKQCKNRDREQRLPEIWTIPIFEGELLNEEVLYLLKSGQAS